MGAYRQVDLPSTAIPANAALSISRRRRVLFRVIATATAIALLEGLSAVGLAVASVLLHHPIRRTSEIFAEQSAGIRLLLETATHHRDQLDSVLGWRYRPGFRRDGDQLNEQGLRSDHEFELAPRDGVLRVAAFGDSFVYGTEVDNDSAWPTVLSRRFPDIEVLNYGVGGYGVDQAYLRYLKEGTRFDPQFVIIGFAPLDLPRVVNRYRRFLDDRDVPVAKPRFTVDRTGKLLLIPNPLPSRAAYERLLANPEAALAMREQDQWYEPSIYDNVLYDWSATARLIAAAWVRLHRRYVGNERILRGRIFNATSPAFATQMALFDAFSRKVRESGAYPLVTILPDRDAIIDAAHGMARPFAPMLDSLRARHIEYVDLTDAFVEAGDIAHASRWFMAGGHYSPAGNAIVAGRLALELRRCQEAKRASAADVKP